MAKQKKKLSNDEDDPFALDLSCLDDLLGPWDEFDAALDEALGPRALAALDEVLPPLDDAALDEALGTQSAALAALDDLLPPIDDTTLDEVLGTRSAALAAIDEALGAPAETHSEPEQNEAPATQPTHSEG
jgi:hypothetical protein